MPTVSARPRPVKPVAAALADTRSVKARNVEFDPPTSALTTRKGKRATAYGLLDVPVDLGYGAGRGFSLTKPDGTVYHCYLGLDHVSCECEGFTHGATERADRRHGDTCGSLGCCHTDALVHLLVAGQLPPILARSGAMPTGRPRSQSRSRSRYPSRPS